MSKIIGILLFVYCVTIDARVQLPITLNTRSNNDQNEIQPKLTYRLPNSVIPTKYILELKPYLKEKDEKQFTFDGKVTILLDVKEKTKTITLHSRNLTFARKDITLKSTDTEKASEIDLNFDEKVDFVNLTSKIDFEIGSYRLEIEYRGKLHDDMRGFYRSSYKNEQGETVWLAATHLEPIGARRVFPCFDEPEYKATFDVTIIHDANLSAISNMQVQQTKDENGIVKTIFDSTPRMSTYLLAFVVSDFQQITDNTTRVIHSVYARPNAIKNGDLALKEGQKLLSALEDYTTINFPIIKMDQAAIPDFAAGAMENWGLVLYREKSLLFDEKVMTTAEKQNIIETIAHEFAHQWFGDLVSPKWWKFVWLNEGFANFFQSYITEMVHPDWRSVDQSVIKSIQTTAFDADSGANTHPINHDVESPSEISGLFDSISYQKGGAIIRMMQHFLTEPVFKKGLTRYLSKNQNKAATSDDLFDALNEEAKDAKLDIDVKTIMNTWVNKKGYPVINVNRNYDHSQVEIEQVRFTTFDGTKNETNDLWNIPINFATQKESNFSVTTPNTWLTTLKTVIKMPAIDTEWVIFNKQQTGFYRVNYDERNWELIIKSLNSTEREQIHVLNRAQLMNDALAFVKQGQLSLKTLLDLTTYLRDETDYIAWYPGFKSFTWLNKKLMHTEYYPTFKTYAMNTAKLLFEHVGFEQKNHTHLDNLSRITAINWVCSLGNSDCTEKMQKKLTAWLNNQSIEPDLKQVTLCQGLRNAEFELWNRTLTKCIATTDTSEKQVLINGLGCNNKATILQYYLNFTTEDNSPLNDYTMAVIKSIYENSDVGVEVALDFVVNRFVTMLRKIKNEKQITTLITGIGERLTMEAQLAKLKQTENKDIPRTITGSGIKAAEKNIQWLKDNKKTLDTWTNGVGTISASFGLLSSLLVITFVKYI